MKYIMKFTQLYYLKYLRYIYIYIQGIYLIYIYIYTYIKELSYIKCEYVICVF